MNGQEALAHGRAAFEQKTWGDAYRELSIAGREIALEPDDLDRLATAAYLVRGVVTSHPGLYFVGLHFLYAFSSTMIHGVGRDAQRIARHIAARAHTRERAAVASAPLALRQETR
jgi:hypothetical protein